VSVVEVTTFRLPEGTDVPSFLALDKRVQTELVPNRPGFIRRTTARRGADWVVVMLWGSEAAAAAFAEAVTREPVWSEFVGAQEPGSQSTQRFDTLD
jgi:hypothetical protein